MADQPIILREFRVTTFKRISKNNFDARVFFLFICILPYYIYINTNKTNNERENKNTMSVCTAMHVHLFMENKIPMILR